MSKGSSKSTQTQQVKLDPATKAWNDYVMGLLSGSFNPDAIMGLQGPYGNWFNRAMGAVDPQAQLAAAQQGLNTVAQPSVNSQAAASGFGNTGASGQAMNQAFMGMRQPIMAQAQQQQLGLQQMTPQFAMNMANLLRPVSAPKTTTTSKQGGSSLMGTLLPLGMMAAGKWL